ncbi:MAG: GrpB family protein [Pseudomonadota bacterium]
MPLTSRITPYDPNWPGLFEMERARIGPAFGQDLVAIFHVGSTAVQDLAAKSEIDLLVEVATHDDTASVQLAMLDLGYVRGKDLFEDHHFYRRNVETRRTHKVHVCKSGHPQIARMLAFRDLLRADPATRRRYQQLKLRLERENTGGIAEYLAGKAPFIDAVLKQALPPA